MIAVVMAVILIHLNPDISFKQVMNAPPECIMTMMRLMMPSLNCVLAVISVRTFMSFITNYVIIGTEKTSRYLTIGKASGINSKVSVGSIVITTMIIWSVLEQSQSPPSKRIYVDMYQRPEYTS